VRGRFDLTQLHVPQYGFWMDYEVIDDGSLDMAIEFLANPAVAAWRLWEAVW
jgi:hypothetical protein